jgi:hypothetical protein
MQHRLLVAYDKSVTRIVAALKPRDSIRAFGKHIHNGALAFVTPLGPNNYYVPAHFSFSLKTAIPNP